MTTLFAIIRLIPILDRWFETASAAYFQWKYRRESVQAEEAIQKAEADMDTEDLQREVGEKL